MPKWSEDVITQWSSVLDLTEDGGRGLDRVLDWRLKHELFTSYIEKNGGFSWPELETWNLVLSQVGPMQRMPERQFDCAIVRYFLRRRGLSPDRFEEVLKLRSELFELDLRFGQLGPRGIFSQMSSAAGGLNHAAPGVRNEGIQYAETQPPANTRAFFRGHFIKRYHQDPGCRVTWDRTVDGSGKRHLDLSDPFGGADSAASSWPL
jgi:hypothetical protein